MPRRCRINCQVPTQTELAGSEAPVLLSFWNAAFRPQTQLKLSSSVMWSRTLSGRMCGRSTPLFKLHSSCPTKLLKLMGEIKRPTCVSFARAKERAANTHISRLCAKGCSLKGMAFESLQLKKKKNYQDIGINYLVSHCLRCPLIHPQMGVWRRDTNVSAGCWGPSGKPLARVLPEDGWPPGSLAWSLPLLGGIRA